MQFVCETKEVSRVFGSGEGAVQALQSVTLQIPKGRLVVLKGRSGSGKTTLLNLIGGLDQPTDGRVIFNGMDIGSLSDSKRTEIRRRNMAFIFQSFGLIPLMSAKENVEFGLRIAGIPPREWQGRIHEALELVGLIKRASHRPFEMSGGEQQRCAIARAIATRPQLILADEPTAELDSKMGLRVAHILKELARSGEISVIMTTHDPAIMEVADDVYSLEDGIIVDVQHAS